PRRAVLRSGPSRRGSADRLVAKARDRKRSRAPVPRIRICARLREPLVHVQCGRGDLWRGERAVGRPRCAGIHADLWPAGVSGAAGEPAGGSAGSLTRGNGMKLQTITVDHLASSTTPCGLSRDAQLSPYVVAQEGYCVAVRALDEKPHYNQLEDANGQFHT